MGAGGAPLDVHAVSGRRLLCLLAMTGFLLLVVAHGVHDAFHEGDAGAIVCIALALGVTVLRLASPAATPVHVLLLRIVAPAQQAPGPAHTFDTRGSPSAGLSPLRL